MQAQGGLMASIQVAHMRLSSFDDFRQTLHSQYELPNSFQHVSQWKSVAGGFIAPTVLNFEISAITGLTACSRMRISSSSNGLRLGQMPFRIVMLASLSMVLGRFNTMVRG
jgi:hypothetical protein